MNVGCSQCAAGTSSADTFSLLEFKLSFIIFSEAASKVSDKKSCRVFVVHVVCIAVMAC